HVFAEFLFRFPSWSFEDWSQFELDTLEDIFKRSDGWQETTLKPALSCILAPALCAVYSKAVFINIDLSRIEVKIQSADSQNCFLPITDERERSRSPELLYPPIANIAEIKERLPSPCDSGRSSPIFVSGYEAERQRNDIQQFGREVACKLAERRAEYAKRRMAQMEKESLIIEKNIKEATKNKIEQLKMADELEKDGTLLKERRAKLWRRCANMTEILAKEETQASLWQQRYKEALAAVPDNILFF
ncbi:hypothetical protein P5673_021454, partial [Acropora cervicornis]